jgi:hypothetical protein
LLPVICIEEEPSGLFEDDGAALFSVVDVTDAWCGSAHRIGRIGCIGRILTGDRRTTGRKKKKHHHKGQAHVLENSPLSDAANISPKD